MRLHQNTWRSSAMLSLVIAAVLSMPAQGQFGPQRAPGNPMGDNNPQIRVNPDLFAQQGADNKAVLGQPIRQPAPANDVRLVGVRGNPGRLNNEIDPYGGGSTDPYVRPQGAYPIYSPFSPYGVYVPNPYEAYLSGLSNVIRAQGQYGIDFMEARLLNQDVIRSKYESRRRIIEYELYRRSLLPTAAERRETELAEEIRRARNAPQLTEILSGDALNALLTSLKKLQMTGARGPGVAVDAKILSQVNVTTGSGGNVGLLRNEGKLTWPVSMHEEKFKQARERIDRFAQDIVIDSRNTGTVDTERLKVLQEEWKVLDKTLEADVRKMSPSDYISARRYLNLLRDAFKALEDPNAANYFRKTFAANGKTVEEVVANMAAQGLTFAPATPGDEAAYRAIHQLLVKLEAALSGATAER